MLFFVPPSFSNKSLLLFVVVKNSRGCWNKNDVFDTSKAESSMYVLTCLGSNCPEKNKDWIYSTSVQVDKFYPSPLRCGKCCRFEHSSKICHSESVCSNCGINGHMRNEYEATESKCVNCKGAHDAIFKKCPNYLCEK